MSGQLSTTILQYLQDHDFITDTAQFAHETAAMQAALASLAARNMIVYSHLEKEIWSLTREGGECLESGSHEARVFNAVEQSLGGLGPSAKFGQGAAFKNGWIQKDGSVFKKKVDAITDKTQVLLTQVLSGDIPDSKTLADMKKRNLIEKSKQISFRVEKGPEFSLEIKRQETDLTAELLQSGAWKSANFKKYNLAAEGAIPQGGALHPLNKVRAEFRQIFFEMGFQEMPTNKFVESCFWNFDALFVPQQHPARDMQDTFYISSPEKALLPSQDYLQKVAQVHEFGGYKSIGYRYPFSNEEAQKLVLRTHTTAISTAMLYKLAQEGFKPAKYFSIDRVFRNETLDATHLAEFHQVEGVIADYNLTLGDLIGFMQRFFEKMGVTNLRFKPTYNPYTEPSMEIYSYHSGLKKWVEIGNSGMFRPEMLEPMGLPKDVRVHGWGLSLERPTMIKYGIDNIRELLGHKVDLEMIQKNEAVRFDKTMGREKGAMEAKDAEEAFAKAQIVN
ncbi:Phenylalanine--tRNA ligase alpha subunit [Neolecta irregularis DAH-3]|uniref:phenylalanine--tRNA ligase n=1 Tax=Neolecta irregularis (strain DAH-3) TaxID=1198029 RepID=A0A1U7LN02_NEOID|nr:Phenylalanine--tRNA ligase alpha subunit [Neolecta irregularis DAH-3]|eukprot:OLL24046.1 Phenylalanine--tRNA ligase alpha subunit [Neolecta irregularis DAH-3]